MTNKNNTIDIAIIMGSDSDLPIMNKAIELLTNFNISFSVNIISAHRTPEKMLTFAKEAEANNYKVIIAGAGGAAHLPGMTASLTNLPVVGVPIKLSTLEGMDSLLSIVQMPKGVPVATVGINNSQNAALLAAKILALSDKNINQILTDFRLSEKKRVTAIDAKLDLSGNS